MPSERPAATAEMACLVIFFGWLATLPLPFGGMIESARFPQIALPIALAAVTAILRLRALRARNGPHAVLRAWQIWSCGALLFLFVIALQLVSLPMPLLRLVSPVSFELWSRASEIAQAANVPSSRFHPVSVDPAATVMELLRLAAIYAAFTTSALLVRNHSRRMVLAAVVCCAALFETLYGVREAAIGRYAIWGWTNRLVFNRVTGTFVNPNHFAHYVAIALPMALFLVAAVWHRTGGQDIPIRRRFVRLMEREIGPASLSLLALAACVAGLLLAQSRGALLALSGGILFVAALAPGRRVRRVAFAGAAGVVIVVTFVAFLGTERTVERFAPTGEQQETLVGRRVGLAAALGVWNDFPLLGSGAGTFRHVVTMEQREQPESLFHHAHDDFAEIAATTGVVGFAIAMGALVWGYASLVRLTFGALRHDLIWRRRLYQMAALASVAISAIHGLVDFNFFIVANPATLASIAGAAVAATDHDLRVRR